MAITAKLLKRQFPKLFEKFDNRDLESFLNAAEPIEVEPGTVLREYGQPAESLFLIWKGTVEQSMTVGGQHISLGTSGAGDSLGTIALVDPGPALATAVAREPCVLLKLDQSGLRRLREANPRAGGKLMRGLSLELSEWLRVYEAYMSERDGPQGSGEFARRGRYLMGIRSD